MKKLIISACLLGVPCRYDGKSKPISGIAELEKLAELLPICPECDGGLPTPRVPAERVGERVINREGGDVTEAYQRGAEAALALARRTDCSVALLKAKSPSCGKGTIYDGSFTGSLTAGNGVCAELLLQNGVHVFSEQEIDALINYLKEI